MDDVRSDLGTAPDAPPGWVDEVLLAGADAETCLWLDHPVTRGDLRAAVAEQCRQLRAAGLRAGGTLALRLPPSLAYIANLLAGWRIGAQVALLDHRLTQHEVDRALPRLGSQLLVEPAQPVRAALRGYHDVSAVIRACDGAPAATAHALIQLSSGSTGPSKVIGRTAGALVAEVDRYVRLDGLAHRGERCVVLASAVHVLGLVGGLLYNLHAGVQIVIPPRLTAEGILATVAAGREPTTLLGVPFHLELLASVAQPPRLPHLVRMVTGGELVRASTALAFHDRYGFLPGNMYGMTELGVIATDLAGAYRPALAPAPGMRLSIQDGQLLVSSAASPYVGPTDPSRWVDGWLHTKDAATIDPDTGLVTIRGRLDSQVSVAGLKVDLTEVEQSLAALPGVTEAVVVQDRAIEAYLAVGDGRTAADLEQALAGELAPYKLPRHWHLLDRLPRTATGKLVRDVTVLRRAALQPL